jgi:hypothetical protein
MSRTGRRQTALLKGEVVAYESVSVPAGSFLGFKIALSLSGRRYQERWYAPETRTLLRLVQYDQQGTSTVSMLMDYQRREESVIGTGQR